MLLHQLFLPSIVADVAHHMTTMVKRRGAEALQSFDCWTASLQAVRVVLEGSDAVTEVVLRFEWCVRSKWMRCRAAPCCAVPHRVAQCRAMLCRIYYSLIDYRKGNSYTRL